MSESAPAAQAATPPEQVRTRAAISADTTLAEVASALVERWVPAQGLRLAHGGKRRQRLPHRRAHPLQILGARTGQIRR